MKRILYLLIISLLFTSAICFADVIKLKNGEIIEGKIININSNQIWFKAKVENDIIIISFDKSEITKVELKPFKFPSKFTIFDRIHFEKGGDFLGLVELEMPEVIYFSLLMERGIGVVGFPREKTLGIEGSYGFRKIRARIFFAWRNFIYKLKDLIFRRNKTRLDKEKMDVILNIMEEEKLNKTVKRMFRKIREGELSKEVAEDVVMKAMAKRKIYGLDSFKKHFKDYRSLKKDKQYEIAIQNKYLVLGMGYDNVKSVLGDSPNIRQEHGKEYWHYPSGDVAIFKRGKLIGFTKEVPNLYEIIERHYSNAIQ